MRLFSNSQAIAAAAILLPAALLAADEGTKFHNAPAMFRSVGLGVVFTRYAILPIEVVACATSPPELVQSDSTNTAFAARRGEVR
jgi:hypothetical protein